MFWASVDFIFINDQIFNFGSVGTFLGGFLIPFYMTLVVFDSFVSVWSDRNFPASCFQPGTCISRFAKVLSLLVVTNES